MSFFDKLFGIIKNKEDRLVNRITDRGCPKCGYYNYSCSEMAGFYYSPYLGRICYKCDYTWSVPNPDSKYRTNSN